MINDPHDVPPLLEITQQEKELTCRFCEQLVCACDDDERLAALFPSYAALLAFTIATKDKIAALTARAEQAERSCESYRAAAQFNAAEWWREREARLNAEAALARKDADDRTPDVLEMSPGDRADGPNGADDARPDSRYVRGEAAEATAQDYGGYSTRRELTQAKEAAEAALRVKEAEKDKAEQRVRELEATNQRLRTSWREDVEEERMKVNAARTLFSDSQQTITQLEAALARLTAYVQHKPECRYRECAKCGYSDRLLHDVTSTAPLRHPFVSVGCTCGLDTLPSTGQASGRTPGEVQAVIDEMTEALGSGAFFNPEMFGSMLKPGDNPILRWRDTLLAAQAGRTPQKENER